MAELFASMPKPQPPTPLPDADSPDAREARRKALTDSAVGGRASTDLTRAPSTAGTGAASTLAAQYAGKSLG